MTLCRSITSRSGFNYIGLCEWFSQNQRIDPKTFDRGETYVDLNDPLHPVVQTKAPDGKISPRELATVVTKALEEEWRQVFLHEKPQPLAEALYDRFKFVPTFFPKPLSRMTSQERGVFHRFLDSPHIRYNREEAMVEDNLLGILEAGVAGCVGMSNLSYFKERIVERREIGFIEVYRDQLGNQHSHIAISRGGQPYDPSYHRPLDDTYYWFPLDPMDQWARSVMNTGITKMERGELDGKAYMLEYGLVAYDLAPNYFRVLANLGETFYTGGQQAIGLHFLRGARDLYPSYDHLTEWRSRL